MATIILLFGTVLLIDAQCGTSHGQMIDNELSPQPIGHFGSFNKTECVNCHPSVVNGDGVIIDKFKHINKEINL